MRNMSWTNEYDRLATYNSEVSRGLIHTNKYKIEMEKIQEEYNKEMNYNLRSIPE